MAGIDLPGEYALLYAMLDLQKNPNSKVVVAGADASGTYIRRGLNSLGFIDKRMKETPHRAFESNASGIIMGEGAVALVCETEESAKSRGAEILATISGFYQASSGGRPFNYENSPNAMAKALKKMTDDQGIKMDEFDLISLSANGSPHLEKAEAKFIEQYDYDIPHRTLCDSIGTFPGGGLARLSFAIAAMNKQKNIHSVQRQHTVNSKVEKRLSQPMEGFERLLHIANGLGGNSVAINVSVNA